MRRLTGTAARPLAWLGSVMAPGSFVRGASLIAMGTMLAQFVAIAVSPILTRLYSPAEFGSYSVALAILSIIAVMSTLAYEEAIPLPDSDVGAANVLALCIAIAMITGGVVMLVLLLVGPALLDLAGAPELAPIAFVLAFAVIGNGMLLAFLGWAIRMKAYGQIAANRLTRAGTGAVTQVGFGILGWGAFGLLLGAILAIFVALARLAAMAWRSDRDAFQQVSATGLRRSLHRYRRFPLLTAPAMLLNTIGLEAPLLIIVAMFGTAVGGQFALAYRVMAMPLTLVANAIGKTYFAEAARIVREDPAGLRRLYVRTTRTLALLTIGPVILGALLAPFVFGLIFGEEWTEAGVFAMILAPMFYLQLVTNPTHGTLIVLERQDLHLQREIARLLLLGGAVAVALALGLDAIGTIAAISVAGVLMYTWYGITSWRAIRTNEDIHGHGRDRGETPMTPPAGRSPDQPD